MIIAGSTFGSGCCAVNHSCVMYPTCNWLLPDENACPPVGGMRSGISEEVGLFMFLISSEVPRLVEDITLLVRFAANGTVSSCTWTWG